MSLFESVCQGIGLALAAGAILGAGGRTGALGGALFVLAEVAGAVVFALSLSGNDHTAWPGVIAGGLTAALGFVVSRAVAVGARARAATGEGGAEGSAVAIGGTIALAALAIAALATLVSPSALVFLAAFGWLGAQQQRRAGRKYEGLRSLR
jgi:hypothetical protein